MRDIMLILHFIGLAMGLGTAFAHAFLGFSASKLTNDETLKLKLNTQIFGRMGSVGLLLLLVSGVYLILPYWSSLLFLPLLVTKLVLFVLLIVLLALINFLEIKAKKAINPETLYRKMELVGKLALLTSIAIVVLAVGVFH